VTFGPIAATTATSIVVTMGTGAEAIEGRGVIFIDDFIDVPLPLAIVRGRFVDAEKWLTDLAGGAEGDGEALRIQIGPTWVGGLMSRKVEVTLGPPRERGEARVMELEWKAIGLASALPVLNGDLELAPLGLLHCRLTLAASYLPPFGELGRALDRALLHRVAQSTVRSFLERVDSSLEADHGGATTRPL
jgi:hypothetical protein